MISDHALVRFLDRAGAMDIENLRARLAASLARAHAAARSVSDSDYLIKVDGLLYVVRGDRVTTVIEDSGEHAAAGALNHQPK
ncbi:MAG: hypothetical protein ACOY45_15635 [Pseudomonadota bacterium]